MKARNANAREASLLLQSSVIVSLKDTLEVEDASDDACENAPLVLKSGEERQQMYGTLASLRGIKAKHEARDSSFEDASLTTKIALSLSVFATLCLVQAKLGTSYVPSWHIVAGPLYFGVLLSG